ncbi:MAG: PadR family transcriptional regulator [Candidatus Asgardarchaeia archaeon]
MFPHFFMPAGGQKRRILEHLILDALLEKPMYGYEIRKYIKERTEGHWKPSFSMIYTTLKDFLESGLVTKRQELIGGRVRNIYSLTDKGKEIVISRKKRFVSFIMSLTKIIDEDLSYLCFLTPAGRLLFSDLTNEQKEKILEKIDNALSKMRRILEDEKIALKNRA